MVNILFSNWIVFLNKYIEILTLTARIIDLLIIGDVKNFYMDIFLIFKIQLLLLFKYIHISIYVGIFIQIN